MTPDPSCLQTFLKVYSFLLIPLAAAEGFLAWRMTGKRFRPAPLCLAAALFNAFLCYGLLIFIPEAITAAGWRFVPDFYIDNTLYFLFAVLIAFAVKYAGSRLPAFLKHAEWEPLKKSFLLLFAGFDLSILLAAGAMGYQAPWNYLYDIARSFAYGIDYCTHHADGTFSDVSQRDFLGKSFDSASSPFPVKPDALTIYYSGSKKLTEVSFDYLPKTFPDGTSVRSNPCGGLLIVRPNGQVTRLNYQTILHRWTPAAFALIPDSTCVLFSIARRNYLYDYSRNNLYDLSFSRDRIIAFGIRLTREGSEEEQARMLKENEAAARTALGQGKKPDSKK